VPSCAADKSLDDRMSRLGPGLLLEGATVGQDVTTDDRSMALSRRMT
jgi:hypothetical protein